LLAAAKQTSWSDHMFQASSERARNAGSHRSPTMNQYYSNRDILQDIGNLLRRRKITGIVDAGAFIGQKTLVLAGLFPDAKIFSFEPNPGTFCKLKLRYAANPNVVCIQAALGSQTSRREFFLNKVPQASSLLRRPVTGKRYYQADSTHEGRIEVDSWTLDQWITENARSLRIELLKLDVQGSELEVLQGASVTLKNDLLLVWTEIEFVELYENAANYLEVASFMKEFGFDLFQLYDLVMADDGQLVYGDALFIKHSDLHS